MHGWCFWLPVPIRRLVSPDACEVSRFSRVQFLDVLLAPGSWTTSGLSGTRHGVPVSVAFPLEAHGRRPKCAFRSSIPGPSMPLSTLHLAPHGSRRKTRGQDGSLLLSCGALSSPTARRFIPTIALADARGSMQECSTPLLVLFYFINPCALSQSASRNGQELKTGSAWASPTPWGPLR